MRAKPQCAFLSKRLATKRKTGRKCASGSGENAAQNGAAAAAAAWTIMARDTAALEAAFGPPLMGQPRCSDPKLQPERSARRRSDNVGRFEETSRSVLIPIAPVTPFLFNY
ncbi:hypothetical protein IscW_ISCW011514 [Ixodes scapularis]|uniref:Uncharacterized protein n=1 Tax=Ixodes scapularis TaxID=6945 RepID=B7Q544_IXOSC|nr:hypothetical protein IscW_ISCW011514 [Ixodes scapularis]|eukprot:XP_002411681.1 hypothetical protein IscW_ISCW011514 [Ixodes scapularis]